jgi:hypothetical protein
MKQRGRGYETLVALPLAFVTIFCFGFVIMQSHSKPQTASASLSSSKIESSPKPAIVQLTRPLPQLSTVPVSQAPTASSSSAKIQGSPSTSQSINTTTPQQSPGNSTSNLQKSVNITARTVGQDLENLIDNITNTTPNTIK